MIVAVLSLIRPYYTIPFTAGLLVIAAYIVGGDWGRVDVTFAYACAALFLVLSGGYALNDVCDVRADTINNPDRPIPKGQVSRKAGLMFSILLFVPGLAMAALAGRQFFGVLWLVALGLAVYDLYSKRLGIVKDLLAAVLMTSLYPLAFILAEPVETARFKALYIFPVWLFMTAFGYEMLKDIRDVKGDSSAENPSRRPLCAKPAFLLWAKGILTAAALFTLLPYILGYCQFLYFTSAVASCMLVVRSLQKPPAAAVPFIYTEVFLITAGSMADLLVYGP